MQTEEELIKSRKTKDERGGGGEKRKRKGR